MKCQVILRLRTYIRYKLTGEFATGVRRIGQNLLDVSSRC